MLGFEHFESLEALRDLGALQAELGRNAEANRFVFPTNGRNVDNGENVRRPHISILGL